METAGRSLPYRLPSGPAVEFLFDLLPLLAIYVLVRVFSRKRTPAPSGQTLSTEDGAASAPMNFEQLLQALSAAHAEADRVADGTPAVAAVEAAPAAAEPVRPSRPAPRESLESQNADARFYDDEASFDRVAPAHAHDEQAGVDAQGFTTATFVEHGMRSHAPVSAPSSPPPRPASGIAARLRNPATAREAFEIQMLLEPRGRRAIEPRRPGASPRRPAQ